MPVRIGFAPAEDPGGDELQPSLFAVPRNVETMTALVFFHYLGQWPADYAQPGWDSQRLTENLQRRGFAGDPWASPARLGDYLEAEGYSMTAGDAPAGP